MLTCSLLTEALSTELLERFFIRLGLLSLGVSFGFALAVLGFEDLKRRAEKLCGDGEGVG